MSRPFFFHSSLPVTPIYQKLYLIDLGYDPERFLPGRKDHRKSPRNTDEWTRSGSGKRCCCCCCSVVKSCPTLQGWDYKQAYKQSGQGGEGEPNIGPVKSTVANLQCGRANGRTNEQKGEALWGDLWSGAQVYVHLPATAVEFAEATLPKPSNCTGWHFPCLLKNWQA